MSRLPIVAVFVAFFASAAAPRPSAAQDAAPHSAGERPASAQEEDDGLPVLVAAIGAGARFRRISLDVGDSLGGTENRSFDTGEYFDFGWHLLIRPWGKRSPRPSMQAMILQIDGGAGIGLTLEPAGTGISLDTNTWRLLGQFGYLYPMGRLLVGGLLGVGGDVFEIDLNSVLPSSRIVYVRFGPAVAYTIIPDYLGVRGDFGLRFPFYLGALKDTFGQDSRAFGLDATATFQGQVKAGFTYALRLVWEYYLYRFSGAVSNVPAMAEGGRGKDHALNIQLLLGWSL